MEIIYVDIHIHTSENPDEVNENYDIDELISNVEAKAKGPYLIGLSDHNMINKRVYLDLVDQVENVLLCCELHIKNYKSKPPYHCHIVFDLSITSKNIDMINDKLDLLYPHKVIENNEEVPSIEEVINMFDNIEFLLLPHGGQSHRTFDKSVGEEAIFDKTLERSIYYNHFDGFTARSNQRLEKTLEYFEKLGISSFVNLLTCTDNYNPYSYPEAKSKKAARFIPTWMLAKPTFSGLRLSLSEKSRFIYSHSRPKSWSEHIEKVEIENQFLDIDVELKPGLNVIIGGSSSGKTLLVDSIYRKIAGDFEDCDYLELGVKNIIIKNPSGMEPYYISQNYIVEIINNSHSNKGIDDIGLIKKVFKGSKEEKEKFREAIKKLKADLHLLIDQVKIIQEKEDEIKRIPNISSLLLLENAEQNLLEEVLPNKGIKKALHVKSGFFENAKESLTDIKSTMNHHPLSEKVDNEVDIILKEMSTFKRKHDFELLVRKILDVHKEEIDKYLVETNKEVQVKTMKYRELLVAISAFTNARKVFDTTLKKISKYQYSSKSKKIVSEGHKLFIENNFKLDKEIFLEVINAFLKNKIENFHDISPNDLYKVHYKDRPKVTDYEDFVSKISSEFEQRNCKKYRIITRDGKDFDKLSAGWKSSVLLDLILGYKKDFVPLIIDQPEDNLATEYINGGLIESIKRIKEHKQIILVSHNATIPMLGDAQNVILCRNINNRIVIRSSELEGEIDEKTVVDYIAKITDGGKSSIKKRVKKYNLKRFR